jgi:hypothetical protein
MPFCGLAWLPGTDALAAIDQQGTILCADVAVDLLPVTLAGSEVRGVAMQNPCAVDA